MYRFIFLSLSLFALIYFLDHTKVVSVHPKKDLNTSKTTNTAKKSDLDMSDDEIKNTSWRSISPSPSDASRFSFKDSESLAKGRSKKSISTEASEDGDLEEDDLDEDDSDDE